MKRRTESSFVTFDIIYEDGTRSSNRRVPSNALDGLAEDEDTAKSFLEAQDREIASASGRPRGPIRTVARSAR
ncbi:MAG TPA: hypothetical protein VH020_14800 [Stellaceae bacterium]|nr:hypothetical protein [Stellaceae bacterium]